MIYIYYLKEQEKVLNNQETKKQQLYKEISNMEALIKSTVANKYIVNKSKNSSNNDLKSIKQINRKGIKK